MFFLFFLHMLSKITDSGSKVCPVDQKSLFWWFLLECLMMHTCVSSGYRASIYGMWLTLECNIITVHGTMTETHRLCLFSSLCSRGAHDPSGGLSQFHCPHPLGKCQRADCLGHILLHWGSLDYHQCLGVTT